MMLRTLKNRPQVIKDDLPENLINKLQKNIFSPVLTQRSVREMPFDNQPAGAVTQQSLMMNSQYLKSFDLQEPSFLQIQSPNIDYDNPERV